MITDEKIAEIQARANHRRAISEWDDLAATLKQAEADRATLLADRAALIKHYRSVVTRQKMALDTAGPLLIERDKLLEAVTAFNKWMEAEPVDGRIEYVYLTETLAPMMRDALSPAQASDGWQTMETAPKGAPILAWCDHEADAYYLPNAKQLTLYAAHAEGMSHAATGYHIVEWGGAFDDSTWEHPNGASLPDWWFVCGSEFEVAANPTRWMPLPPPPRASQDKEVG